MNQVKQIRRKMFGTRDFKKRLELMFLIRALDWKEKEKAAASTATEQPFGKRLHQL